MTQPKKEIPASAKRGEHDLRSTDLSGRKANAVKPHGERASEAKKPEPAPEASGEVAGALRDQMGH